MDRVWWRRYLPAVREQFQGELACPLTDCFGVPKVHFDCGRNSGLGAIALAHHCGAKRIILLGYDCKAKGGKRHWHADHPAGMGNAGKLDKWPAQFKALAEKLAGSVDIINASRESALTCFPRQRLEEVLCASSSLQAGHRPEPSARLRA